MRRCLPLLLAFLSVGAVVAITPQPPRAEWVGRGIQRTMTLLAQSTPEKRNTVRILFYGQSITKQDWWKEVVVDLRQRFPHADLVAENHAIGGFAADRLQRPLAHDVYPFYPDLIIFHDYGGEPDYEKIVTEFRRRTTTELLLTSDHITKLPPPNAPPDWHDRHVDWLFALAEKIGAGVADIRTMWKVYLKENQVDPASLLMDGAHLNEPGCHVMASFILPHLVYLPDSKDTAWKSYTSDIRPAVFPQAKEPLSVAFVGNRIDLLPSDKMKAGFQVSVLIDGKKPSEISDCWAATRPSDCPGVDVPALTRVTWKNTPVAEEWTATLNDVSEDGKKFTFNLEGTVTGKDGGGKSSEDFASPSGRVVIESQDWFVRVGTKWGKEKLKDGFQVKWRTYLMGVDSFVQPEKLDGTKENAVTLGQGFPAGEHKITLSTEEGKFEFLGLRAYNPPLK